VAAAAGPLLLLIALQGAVMVLQNRYQRGRLYAAVAAGRARTVDVPGGEASGGGRGVGGLALLLPPLMVFQACEMMLGARLAFIGVLDAWTLHWGGGRDGGGGVGGDSAAAARAALLLPVAGGILALLGAGNLRATLQTVKAKRRALKSAGSAGGGAGGRKKQD